MLATLFQKTTPISYVYTALLMVGAIVYQYMEGMGAPLALPELGWYFLDGTLALAAFFCRISIFEPQDSWQTTAILPCFLYCSIVFHPTHPNIQGLGLNLWP